MLRLLTRAYLAALLSSLGSASIYPTNPIASTVLGAGRVNTIQWIDDGKWPTLDAMGPVKIDLYVGETYVATLAEGIYPNSLSADVWISPSWRHNGSDYFLLFTGENPKSKIYTADFTISGMANDFPYEGPVIDAQDHAAPSLVYITPRVTFVLPDATVVSTLKPTISTPPPSVATPPPTTTPEATPQRARSGAAAMGLRKRPPVDLEGLKFRFVFVFWPTVIGLTMAL